MSGTMLWRALSFLPSPARSTREKRDMARQSTGAPRPVGPGAGWLRRRVASLRCRLAVARSLSGARSIYLTLLAAAVVGIGVFTVDARADKGRQQIATMKDPKRLAAASAEFGYYKCLEATLRKAVPTGARGMLRHQQQISPQYA